MIAEFTRETMKASNFISLEDFFVRETMKAEGFISLAEMFGNEEEY